MAHKTIKVFLFSSLIAGAISCYHGDTPEFRQGEVEGYKPVYASDEEVSILFEAARPLKKPGKIYAYGHYLLVNEKGEGIHFFDNTNPEDPQQLGFLRVYGNIDMAIRNNILFVDHIGDLVSLDISDPHTVHEISRTPSWTNRFPPDRGRYFECVDGAKGNVVGWVLATIRNPKCYR
jgi:hypothetical protein